MRTLGLLLIAVALLVAAVHGYGFAAVALVLLALLEVVGAAGIVVGLGLLIATTAGVRR